MAITTQIKLEDRSGHLDAFARFRISQPQTIFDSKQIHDNLPLFWDDQEVSGSGTTSTFSANKARTQLAVSDSTAGKRIRQTFMRFNYQPGKSQLVILTGVLGKGTTGITQQLGYFDDDNGIFFQCVGGVVSVVVRTNATGTPVDTTINQEDWNLDQMMGNKCTKNEVDSSTIRLDFTKTQIFFFDFEWLGVGRIRFGFFHNGVPIYVHEQLHSNNLAEVYMSTPNLPVRYSIENDGSGVATILDHICSTVISEGGSEDTGVLRYKSTEGTHIVCSNENTIYGILGIRLKSTHLGASILIRRINIQIQTQSENGEWIWVLNPTIAGSSPTWGNETNSAVQTGVFVAANTITGGTQLDGGFAESTSGGGGSGGTSSPITNELLLGSKIDGTVDEMVLCWRPIGGTTNNSIEGSITWREQS